MKIRQACKAVKVSKHYIKHFKPTYNFSREAMHEILHTEYMLFGLQEYKAIARILQYQKGIKNDKQDNNRP